jgi:hypothetical protein
MVVGMMWQFVVSLAVLRHELGGLHWLTLKKRIWVNLPRSPRTGKPRKGLFEPPNLSQGDISKIIPYPLPDRYPMSTHFQGQRAQPPSAALSLSGISSGTFVTGGSDSSAGSGSSSVTFVPGSRSSASGAFEPRGSGSAQARDRRLAHLHHGDQLSAAPSCSLRARAPGG